MKAQRGGFTLFELILAIALSAALLALIGAAINLYLMRVDASRTQVEEAQLARSILAMIADDIRATTIYQPQDTAAIAELMASGTPFDVDSIDDERSESSDNSSGTGDASSGDGSSFGSSGTTSTGSSSATANTNAESDSTMPLGLSGSLNELYVDVTRLPRREELFSTLTGYTNAPLPMQAGGFAATASVTSPAAGVMPPSDVKTIRYFIREGERIAAGSVAATSLAPELQSRAAGLVRQEIARPLRLFAEQTGNSVVLDSGQSLIAPEVVYVEFRYYDGEQTTDEWDMVDEKSLPRAIEVKIWLASADALKSAYDPESLIRTAREYRQTVFLPMAECSQAGTETGGAESSSSSSESSSSSGSSSSSASGTGFGQP